MECVTRARVAQGGQFDDGAEQDGGQHQEAPGIDDALIQPYSGHATRQSLEIYSRRLLAAAEEHGSPRSWS